MDVASWHRTMCVQLLLLFVLVILVAVNGCRPSEMPGDNCKITVALLENRPFVKINGNDEPIGLDMSILKHFIKKYDISVDYIIANDSLNSLLTNKQHHNKSNVQTILR